MTECSICYETIKNQAKLDSCNHVFCVKCIKTWVRQNNSCPLCRQPIGKITGKRKRDTMIVKRSLNAGQREIQHVLRRFVMRVMTDNVEGSLRRTRVLLIPRSDRQENDISTLEEFENVLPLERRRVHIRRVLPGTRENPIVVD